MRVGVIIPALNEEEALPLVLAELPRGRVHQLLVVDNGSRDATAARARACGATVVHEPRRGYGRACLTGIAALGRDVDVVAFLDADHSDYAEELDQVLTPIAQGRADLVIGTRTSDAAARRVLTPQQRAGNALACWLIERLLGMRYTDLGPFRAVRRGALERLAMRDTGCGWTVEMQVKAVKAGLRVVEVPVHYRSRIGRSKISGTVGGTIRAGWSIITTILRYAV